MYIPIANRGKTFSQTQKMQRMFETKKNKLIYQFFFNSFDSVTIWKFPKSVLLRFS